MGFCARTYHGLCSSRPPDNLHSGTKDNPADDPSRKAELREPVPPAHWLASLLRPQAMRRHAARHRPLPYSFARELFAGCAALTTALKGAGLRVGVGRLFECYTSGCYDMKSDLTRIDVVEALERDILSGDIYYLRFGTPCSSWGPAGRPNHGTRSKNTPEGDGSLKRETLGNMQAEQTAELCRALIKANGHFSIENPAGSYLFDFKAVYDLASLTPSYMIKFCQCAHGLRFPDGAKNQHCRKNAYVFTNKKELRNLERGCPGVSDTHVHVHAWGSMKIKGKSVNRASLAGLYPEDSCSE